MSHSDVVAVWRAGEAFASKRKRANVAATNAPASCAAMKAGTSVGLIPANVSESERAIVMAGLANEVDAVNQ